jgi:SAM-dependent methyltransferase
MTIRRDDKRIWHQGPFFDYLDVKRKMSVNVTISSWPIQGLKVAKAVRGILNEYARRGGGNRVLDFGAGSWLRYVKSINGILPTPDIYAIEFDQAFHDDSEKLRNNLKNSVISVTFWPPGVFLQKSKKFDLILLVNVLNTIPEEAHQRGVFNYLSQRLNPLGWLVLYQRMWAVTDNPPGAVPYGNGWFIPQPNYNCYTYRASTGANWFNARAEECGLNVVPTKTRIKSSNTLLRVWEKPFDN